MTDVVNFPAFLLAALALCVMPGPDCMYLLGRTLAQGRRSGVVSACGITVGAAGHVLAAALGLSAFLAASAEAFLVLKYAGAAYLIYLGVQSFRSPALDLEPAAPLAPARRDRTLFMQGVLTDILNPKVALFFLAFLPQFIAPQAQHKLAAFLSLGGVVLAMGFAWDVLVVFSADRVIRRLRGSRAFERMTGRVLGGVLVGLGLVLACEER